MYQIGVDIGGTNIKIGLVDDALEIVERRSIRFPHDGPQSVADKLAEAIREVLTAAQVPETVLQSIGIVVPGSIDPTGEIVINAYNLGFHDVPFKKLMEAHFPNVPVLMANDATARRWRSCIRARSPDAGRRCSSRSARDSAAASF